MEKSNNIMDPHNMVYPYLRMDHDNQQYWSNALEYSMLADDILRIHGGQCTYINELSMALRILEQQYHYNPKRGYFVDCLGNGGIGGFIALAYHYHRTLSIEPCKQNYQMASKCWESLQQEQPWFLKKKCTLIEGSMQDYFPVDGTVYFLNATELTLDSGVDESLLIYLFLKLCQKILSGSYLIVFTFMLQLDTIACQEMNIHDIICIHHELPKEIDDYSYELGPHCHIWILQKIPTVVNSNSTATKKQKMLELK